MKRGVLGISLGAIILIYVILISPMSYAVSSYLISPYPDQSFVGINDIDFNVTAVDVGSNLANCTLWTNTSGTWQEDGSADVSGMMDDAGWTLLSILNGTYSWNAECCNTTDCAWNDTNQSFSVSGLMSDVMPPNITFLQQLPADVDSINLFGVSLNISYDISDDVDVNESSVDLSYWINMTEGCYVITNGTSSGCTFTTASVKSNVSSNWTFRLFDNNVYPAVYNFDERAMETTEKSFFPITNGNHQIAINLNNVSINKRYNIFEVYANATSGSSVLGVFYCNESYNRAVQLTSSDCYQFGTISSSTAFNHTHGANSFHHVVSMAVNTTTGYVGTVKMTPTGFFAVRRIAGTGTWGIAYITNLTRPNATMSRTYPAAFADLGGSMDAHLHQFDGTEKLTYYVCANDTSDNHVCSSIRTDLLNLSGIPPTSAQVYHPANSSYAGLVAINYTAAESPNSYAISHYNVTLFYWNGSFAQTIIGNNSQSLSYLWNSTGTPDNNYTIQIEACDTFNLCSYGFSEEFVLDTVAPVLNQTYPPDGYINSSQAYVDVNFSCLVNDTNYLSNVTLYITSSTNSSFAANGTTSLSGSVGIGSWVLNLSNGNYTWNCLAYDAAGNYVWGTNRSVNISFVTVIPPNITITKSVNQSTVKLGGKLTYTIAYNNTGGDATGAFITEYYSANTTFISADPAPNISNNVWILGNVSGSSGGIIRINVSVNYPLINSTPILNNVTLNYSNTTGGEMPLQYSTATSNAVGDLYEPDDDSTLATWINADGVTQYHTFELAGDNDWFKFNATAGAKYVLRTYSLRGGLWFVGFTDTIMTLYDQNASTVLDSNDDIETFAIISSRIIWTAPATGTYYFNVTELNSMTGGYNVSVTELPVVNVSLVYPTTNISVQKYGLFNFTINVSCGGINCSGISVYLDPQEDKTAKNSKEKAIASDMRRDVSNLEDGRYYDVMITLRDVDEPAANQVKSVRSLAGKKISGISASAASAKSLRKNQLEARMYAVDEKQDSVLFSLGFNKGISVMGTKNSKFELGRRYSVISALSGKMTKEGIEMLKNNPGVESVQLSRMYHITLNNSTKLVRANDTWARQYNGINLTGIGQTVCVIDTGINYNHSDFGGANGFPSAKVVGGYDFVHNDADPWDDQSHGSHCAGIVASQDSAYPGVAPGAKIVAIKACDSGGGCNDADVIAGIDWCVNNAEALNISVISLSLGDGTQHNSNCDSEPMARAVNYADSLGITVAIAAGNEGYTAGVSSPACASGALAVGNSNKADVPSVDSNNGNTLSLWAPGSSIVATNYVGGHTTKSGTSMATPHVAGAAAILNQYYSLHDGLVLHSASVKDALVSTGPTITNDSVTRHRLDVLAAVEYPIAKGMISNTTGAVPFYTLNDNPYYADIAAGNSTQFVWTVNATGNYSAYRFFAFVDVPGEESEIKSQNITITILDTSYPSLFIVAPASGTMTNQSSVAFSFNVTDTTDSVFNCSIYLDGALNATNVSVEKDALTVFDKVLADGNHTWRINCSDAYGNVNVSSLSLLIVDTVSPTTNITGVTDGSVYSSNVSITLTAFDALSGINYTSYKIDGAAWQNYTGAVGYGVEGAHIISYYSVDNAMNFEVTKNLSFIIDITNPSYSGFGASASVMDSNETLYIWSNWTDDNPAYAVLKLNGTDVNASAYSAFINLSWKPSPADAEKNFTLSIWANDTAGRYNETYGWSVRVNDVSSPVVYLLSPGNGTFRNSSVLFSYNASDVSISNCSIYVDDVLNSTNSSVLPNSLSSFGPFLFADGYHNWSVDCFDGSGNLGISGKYYFEVDSIGPQFFGIVVSPPSPAVYTSGQNYYFNITFNDTVRMGSVWMLFDGGNYSVSNESDVYMFNRTSLDAGNHTYRWFADDGASNLNSTDILFYNVTRADSYCSLSLTPSTTVVYGGNVTATCSCTNPEVGAMLYVNGSDSNLENDSAVFLGAGDYNYSCVSSDTQNYMSYTNQTVFTVTKATPSLYLTVSPGSSVTYGTPTNVSCTADTGQVTPLIYLNGTLVSNPSVAVLGAADYNYTCNSSSVMNYDVGFNTTIITVGKASDSVSISLNNVSNQNISVVYPATVTAFGYSNSSTDYVWRNNTLVTEGLAEALGAGLWAYTVNSSGNQNYTANSTGLTYHVLVNQTYSAVNLLLNGQDADITVNISQAVNITGLLITGDGDLELYQDSILINSGTVPLTNVTNYTIEGLYNITIVYPATQNHTSSFETHFVNVSDVVAPDVTLLYPGNNTWNTSLTQVLGYYADDLSSALQNCSLYVGGVLQLSNTSVVEGNNMFTKVLSAGTHTWYVVCYDNSSQKNIKQSDTWTIKLDNQAPTTNINGVTNGSYYNSNVNISFSASDIDSGVNYTAYRIDAGVWTNYSSVFSYGAEGIHTIIYYSTDNAGNTESAKNVTFTIDTIGPALNITYPLNNADLSGTVHFNVTSADSDHVVMKINNATICDDVSSPFSCSLVTTSYTDGIYTLNATGYDALGNYNSTAISVRIDNGAPSSAITYPIDNFLTSSAVVVNGTASDGTGVGVAYVEFYNGTAWSNATYAGGTWNHTVYYSSGTRNIRSRAIDALGNAESAGAGINIIFDTAPPTISNIQMNPNPVSNATPVGVSVDVVDVNGVALVNATLNGTVITLSYSSGNAYTGSFTSPSEEGVYNLTILARDNASNTATDSAYQLSVNISAPIITLSPVNGSVFNNGTSIIVNVSNAVSSYYNTTADPTPSYFTNYTAFNASGAEGAYVVYVWANSSSGAYVTRLNSYTIDNIAPVVYADSLPMYIKTSSQNISGNFTEPNLDHVNVNGAAANLDGVYYWRVVLLSEGNNSVNITAYDSASNSASLTGYIFLDTVTPSTNHSLSGTLGDNGWYTSDVTVIFYSNDGALSSGTTTQYDVGSGWANNNSVALSSTSSVTYRTIDNAGNNESNKTTGTVGIDKQKPSVTDLAVSTASPIANVSLTMTANITDTNALAPASQQMINIDGTNHSMSLVSGNIYKYDYTPTQAKLYSVRVYGRDIAGNVNSTATTTISVGAGVTDTGITFLNDSLNPRNYSGQVDTYLQVDVNTTVTGNLSVVEYPQQPGSVNASLSNAVKYVDINLSDNVGSVLEWMVVRVYYSDSEISGLDESSLSLKYYNSSSGSWVLLSVGSPAWVNGLGVDASNNYVWANISHLSMFGLSGSLLSGGSTGGGGGGSGATASKTPIVVTPTYSVSLIEAPKNQQFNIIYGGSVFSFKVKDFTGSLVYITSLEDVETYSIINGLSKGFDFDKDGKFDVNLGYSGRYDDRALLTAYLIQKVAPIAVLPPAERKRAQADVESSVLPVEAGTSVDAAQQSGADFSGQTAVASDVATSDQLVIAKKTPWYFYLFAVLVALILVVVLGLFVWEKKRKKTEPVSVSEPDTPI